MKISIVYSSTTGNTEQMASIICEELKSKGAEVTTFTADNADSSALDCDVLLLGSPAMGDEVLEDSMEEYYCGIESSISGKKVGLFGSYDWGDGQWIRDWAERVKSSGATLIADGVTAHLAPEGSDVESCKNLATIALS